MPIVLWSYEQGFGDGDPVVSLPGSGEAIPRGLEAVFEYNGLVFNDLSKVDKFRLLSITGLDDADVRDSREVKPGKDGEDDNISLYGGRTLALRGRIEAYQLDKLRDMQMALRTAFAELTEQPLYFLTGDATKDHFINCKKFTSNQWGEEQQDNKGFFREFLVTVRASDPRFQKNQRSQYTIGSIGSSGLFSTEVVNNGNYKALPEIKMIGPFDNFTITNETTGQVFKTVIANQILEGDFYVLNCANNTLMDSDGLNVFNQVDPAFDTDFIVPPGTSFWRVNVLGSISDPDITQVEIKFRDSYI